MKIRIVLARLSYFNLRPTTLFSRSGKVISAKVYLLKWLGCSLGRNLGRSNLTSILFQVEDLVK